MNNIIKVTSIREFVESLNNGDTSVAEMFISAIYDGITDNSTEVTIFTLQVASTNQTLTFKLPRTTWVKSIHDISEKVIKNEQYEIAGSLKILKELLDESEKNNKIAGLVDIIGKNLEK